MPTIDQTKKKLLSFTKYPMGWRYGEGVPAPSDRVSRALRLIDSIAEIEDVSSDAFLGVGGQVQFVMYKSQRFCEVTVEEDNTITIGEEFNKEDIYFEEGLSIDQALNKLEEYAEQWNSSESFAPMTMSPSKTESPAWPSQYLPTGASRSLKMVVLSETAAAPVPISKGFTITLQGNQGYIGGSMEVFSFLPVAPHKKTAIVGIPAITTYMG